MPTFKRSIICTLTPVGPQVARNEQWFALSVAAGFTDVQPGVNTAPSHGLLFPSNWGWIDQRGVPQVQAWIRPSGTTVAWKTQSSTLEEPSARVPALEPAIDPEANWLDLRELRAEPPESTDADPPAPLAFQLAHLATYPGGLAVDMKLTGYVRFTFPVELADLELELVVGPKIVENNVTFAPDAEGQYDLPATSIETRAHFHALKVPPRVVATPLASLGPDPVSKWVKIKWADNAGSDALAKIVGEISDLPALVATSLQGIGLDDPSPPVVVAKKLLDAAAAVAPADVTKRLVEIINDRTDELRAVAVAHSKQWLETAVTSMSTKLSGGSDPVDQAARDWLAAWKLRLPHQLDAIWAAFDRPSVSNRPTGLSVQLGELQEDPDRLNADSDPWQHYAGFVVLVKRLRGSETTGTWKLANGARVSLAGDRRAVYADSVLIPSKLSLRDGIRHPFATYDHRSLVAHSPLDDARGETIASEPTQVAAKIRYDAPRGAPHFLLPQLRYGDRYQLAVAAMDLAGGLPAELCDARAPWNFLPPIPNLVLPAGVATEEARYLRDVPVGKIGIERVRSTVADVAPHIFPLSREAPPLDNQPDPPLIVVHWNRGKSATDAICELVVTPPSVDVDVLERWSGVEAAASLRDRELTNNLAQAAPDPAVTKFVVSIRELIANKWTDAVSFPREAKPFTLKCIYGEGGISKLLDDGTLRLAVPSEEWESALPRVYAIEVAPWVSKRDASMFSPEALQSATPIKTDVTLPGYCLMIERASPRMPHEEELMFSLTPRDRDIEVRLITKVATLDCVASAEVIRHSWSWAGRPRPRWPERTWPAKPTQVVRDVVWERAAFIDLVEDETAVPPLAERLPVARYVHGQPLLVDRWPDPISHYARYTLSVASRYAAMFPTGQSSVEARIDGKPRWEAAYLPATKTPPRPPVVRAIIPLTKAAKDAGGKPPGLMVLFDEPAFRDFGISEGMTVELVTAIDHGVDGNRATQEYGRDPILPDVAARALGDAELALVGPYGLSNDLDSALTPLFDASCYVLQPPFAATAGWDFAKVRFRRLVEDIDPPPTATDESCWTRPYWVQFLAPAEALAPTHMTLVDRELTLFGVEDTAGFLRYAIITARVHTFEGLQVGEVYIDAIPIVGNKLQLGARRPDLMIRICEVQGISNGESLWSQLFPTDTKKPEPTLRITRISSPIPIQELAGTSMTAP